ncbi:MAG TPA: protein kinase [Anaerolineae bacterium]|nr:protein kinase [Anaerolineae bacterium]
MALAQDVLLEDRYKIEKLISQGGMGTIYKGFDTKLRISVAIKENFLKTQQAIEQFEQEALILARLQHPNLPRVTDHFVHDDKQYLVMDFIEGRDLWEIFEAQGEPLDEEVALDYVIQICDALEYLHRQSPPIIHRDIKPQNIKITPEGRAVLVDFGIAKIAARDTKTSTGAQAVTPGFSPPEQYGGMGTNPKSDVYSLGATLYAVLTGKHPPDSISLMAGGVRFEPPNVINTKLSHRVSTAIVHAMQVQQQHRPASAEEWKHELLAIVTGAEAPTQLLNPTVQNWATPGLQDEATQLLTPPPKPRPPWLWLVAAGLILAAGSGVLAFLWSQNRPDPAQLETQAFLMSLAATATEQARTGALQNNGPDLGATLVAVMATATAQMQALNNELTSTPLPDPPTPTPTATLLPPTETATATSTPTATSPAPTATPTVADTEAAPVVSNSGSEGQIAFVSNRTGNNDIFVMAVDGSNQTNLTNNTTLNEIHPAWSPAGNIIAYASNDITEPDVVENSSVRLISLEDDQSRLFSGVASFPAWSPAGDQIAILGFGNRLSVIDIDGEGSSVVTPGTAFNVDWSPDGSQLVFDNQTDLFVANSDGSGSISYLTGPPADEIEPAWSPDGTQIAFASNGDGNWEIYVMDAGGGNARRLTVNNADDRQPVWSPAGSQIAFASRRDGNWEIYVMNADGSAPTNLTFHPADDIQPAWSP